VHFLIRRAELPPLFPYTTLFRSSTDYDTSDRLYFEPVTLEDVLEICRVEQPKGVIVQYGGQTPLKLCRALEEAGVPIIGTSPDADRKSTRLNSSHVKISYAVFCL